MGLIMYEDQTLIDAKNQIDICNGEILEALEKIFNEFESMESTLYTPKFRKSMPGINSDLRRQVNLARRRRENYNRMFDVIREEYRDYYETIHRMVGGDNNE